MGPSLMNINEVASLEKQKRAAGVKLSSSLNKEYSHAKSF
jgi:hypothetical protein